MSEIIYNLDEAKTSLSQLVDRAARGEEIILCKAGKPLAKLVPYQQNPKPRQPGGWEGQVRISEDFDAPVPLEIQAAFKGVDEEIPAPAREGTSIHTR
ncbi:MAG TPA: type II toxin-antitoxin system prevent-host-death family antitoxin [Thermoanaerobaculia bacterium]|jgi:prevent-host-death family protein|nr:type II toxin-antitoxin system prevent-host-death family antitoxin [Thermoanaerobaculia bacterium]